MTPRSIALASAVLLALVAVACTDTGESYSGEPTVEATDRARATAVAEAGTPTSSPTPSPTVVRPPGSPPLTRPLEELSAEAAGLIEYFFPECCVGIAVFVPDEGVIYELNGDMRFEMASVAKVPFMLTLLAQAEEEERQLTADERELLAAMITLSDNEAADTVYNLVGGPEPVYELFADAGVPDAQVAPAWGATTISAADAARLMNGVIEGEVVSRPYLEITMGLLENVAPYQAWGTANLPPGAESGVKNGWYLEASGWLVNSLGYVIPEDGPAYTVAVFTLGIDNYFTALATVDSIAGHIHFAMR
jgi:hypothetical protein